jgi:hypothetical protein
MKRVPQTNYYDFSAVPRVTGHKQKYREEYVMFKIGKKNH